jgi:type III secretion system FlhB-like substrate exporter
MENENKQKRVVGLGYEPGSALPQIILKGSGPLADTILAQRSKTKKPQVYRNDELVEKLYRMPIDSFIGPDLYRLVAVMLAHVFAVEAKLKGEKQA